MRTTTVGSSQPIQASRTCGSTPAIRTSTQRSGRNWSSGPRRWATTYPGSNFPPSPDASDLQRSHPGNRLFEALPVLQQDLAHVRWRVRRRQDVVIAREVVLLGMDEGGNDVLSQAPEQRPKAHHGPIDGGHERAVLTHRRPGSLKDVRKVVGVLGVDGDHRLKQGSCVTTFGVVAGFLVAATRIDGGRVQRLEILEKAVAHGGRCLRETSDEHGRPRPGWIL